MCDTVACPSSKAARYTATSFSDSPSDSRNTRIFSSLCSIRLCKIKVIIFPMAKVDHFLFVDESGDPGKPFQTDDAGNKSPTGASLYYILSTVCLTPPKLYQLEHRLMEVKSAFGYLKEIKANDV